MTEPSVLPEGGKEFARLTLDGERFSNARMPLESLDELKRYKQLVIEAAASVWVEEHPSEVLPIDFNDQFELTLAPFQKGSAISVLERASTDSPYEDYFNLGRDAVLLGLEAIVVSAIPPTDLEFVSSPAFRDFGSSLLPHESLRLSPTPGAQTSVSVTPEIYRTRIKPTYEKAQREANDRYTALGASVAGRLVALNANARNFTVHTLLFDQVNGRYSNAELTSDLRAVLDSSATAPVVRFTGRLRFNGNRLERILDIDGVELFEVSDAAWSAKLMHMASLHQGWGEDGGGEVISFAALDAAKALLGRLEELDLDRPGIFPMEEGGIQLEWASLSKVTNVEIDPEASLGLFSLSVASKTVRHEDTSDINAAVNFLAEVLQ